MSNSKITKVSIYRNGCFISREGFIDLKQGKHNVVLDTLSDNIDTNTVSISLPEQLNGSNVQVLPLSSDKKEEILLDIQNQISLLNSKIITKEKQLEMWNTNADFSNSTSISINEMSEYIEKLPERLEKIYVEIQELNKQKKKLNKELEKKNLEATIYEVSADIEASQDGSYPYLIQYKDPRAYWNPLYEIRTLENDELSILFKAKIYQDTKEDFKDVKLSLYTGNPSLSNDIPVLNPEILDYYVPDKRAATSLMASRTAYDEVLEEYGIQEEMTMAKVVDPVGISNQKDTMMQYELNNTWDINSDNEIVLDIEQKNIPCRYHVIAIPKLDDTGYLAAQVDVNDIDELIQSSATIYHDNTYVGEVYIDIDSDQDKYDISLGRDETIKIKRQQKKKYTSNVLLKNQKKVDYEYELTVNSTKNKNCQVTLIDQVPISQDKIIVVDIEQISKAQLEEQTGKLTWDFELQPKENKTFELKYSISYPKDKMVNI